MTVSCPLFPRFPVSETPHGGGERSETKYIIIHATQMVPVKAVLDHFASPQSKVSCHYVIDEAGQGFSLVPHAKIAWHAGKSGWRDDRGLNDCSIGIELVYAPIDRNARLFPSFPEKQIETLRQVLEKLVAYYRIPGCCVLAHSDIAPGRKWDPGPAFPWQAFRKEGYGLGAKPLKAASIVLAEAVFAQNPPSLTQIAGWLRALGYPVSRAQALDALDTEILLAALDSFECHLSFEGPKEDQKRRTLAYLKAAADLLNP